MRQNFPRDKRPLQCPAALLSVYRGASNPTENPVGRGKRAQRTCLPSPLKNIIFGASYAEKYILWQKHTSAVPEQQNRFRKKPTIPQKIHVRKHLQLWGTLFFLILLYVPHSIWVNDAEVVEPHDRVCLKPQSASPFSGTIHVNIMHVHLQRVDMLSHIQSLGFRFCHALFYS